MSGSSSRAPLSVVTDDLTLTVDGVEFDVSSTGERLFVEVDGVRDAIHVVRRLPEDGGVSDLAPLMHTTGLTVEFRVRGRTVALVGADSRPGELSRRLGVAPAEFRLDGIIGAIASGLATMRGAGRRLFLDERHQ